MESFMLALTPAGCSYINKREALNRFTGIFGLDSIDKNSLKSACGLSESILFSRLCSQVGARWTFLMRTQDPLAAALLIALSALARPSLDPMAILVHVARDLSTRLSTL